MSELSTRIQLKRDTAANWNAVSSDFTLLSGELGFETDTGLVKIGIGKTWGETPYIKIDNLSDVYGLEAALAGVQQAAIEATQNTVAVSVDCDITDVADGTNTGDVQIIKKLITDNKYEYTAYAWDAELSDWRAMDGNYSADNVYLDSNIGLAGGYTQVGNISKSGATGELSCKGWSVKKLFNEIFDKTVQPTLGANPSSGITLTSAGWKEIGTIFNPSYIVSYTQGKYNTPWDSKTVNDGTAATAYAVVDSSGHTATTATGSFDSFTVLSSTSYTVSATTSYSAGTVAKDNKGQDSDPVVQRAAGSVGTGSSTAVKGYFPDFWGFKSTTASMLPENPTSDQLKALTHVSGSAVTFTPPAACAATASWYQLVVACPSSLNKTIAEAKDSNNVTVSFTKYANATEVDFGEGGKRMYDVFICNNADLYDPTTITITWA